MRRDINTRLPRVAHTARLRRIGDGIAPGSRRASRTAAATMPAMLMTRNRPRIPRIVPRPRCIFSVERATAGTGTEVVCSPPSPLIWNRTSHEPEAISQRLPVKNVGSAVDLAIESAVGGCLEASPVMGRGVILMLLIFAPLDRTSMVATPGITVGMRMVT